MERRPGGRERIESWVDRRSRILGAGRRVWAEASRRFEKMTSDFGLARFVDWSRVPPDPQGQEARVIMRIVRGIIPRGRSSRTAPISGQAQSRSTGRDGRRGNAARSGRGNRLSVWAWQLT